LVQATTTIDGDEGMVMSYVEGTLLAYEIGIATGEDHDDGAVNHKPGSTSRVAGGEEI